MKTPFIQRLLIAATVCLFLISNRIHSQAFTENFDDINLLSGSGWFLVNNSLPLGSTSWFQGNNVLNGGPFDSFNGAANSYIAANFNNTSGGTGTISTWLLTPNRTFRNGDVLTFYTRKVGGGIDYPDRLEVRLSTNGASTNVGAPGNNVGDFTTVLLSINPSLVQFGYPTTWTQYTITLSGLPAPTSGRIAFRYFVTNAGPSGTNSDYIGIDNVVYSPYVCPAINVNASAITNGVAGTSYNATVTGTGFLGAGNFAVTAGSLPPGLTLSANGNITGTPTATGTFNFTISGTDASGCSGNVASSITITCPPNPIVINTVPNLCTNDGLYTLVEGTPAGGTYTGTGVTGGEFDPSSGTQTIIYDYVDPYGCAHSDNFTITVLDTPAVDLGPDISICEGEEVTLSGPNATVNTWDNGVLDATPFAPTATNTYTLTALGGNGCTSTATITVNVNPAPVFDLGSDIVSTDVSVLIAGPAGMDSYLWSNGETSPSTLLNGTGSYWLTVTDANGCSYTDTVNFISTFSVEELENAGISVYPNPTNSVVNISFKDKISEQVKVELFNVTGQKILVRELNDVSNLQISVEHLPSGVYFINVVLGTKNHLVKLIRN